MTIHFHHSDDRFCGSHQQMRRFATDPNKVTCADCMSRDTFVLSPAAAAYVAELERAAKEG
jgi:hypothetical protein